MNSLSKWLADFEVRGQSAPDLELYFLGEGKGESIIINLEGHFTAVIDAAGGTRTSVTSVLLNKLGISKLDFLQLSHFHSDHFSGLSNIFDGFQINSFGRPHVINYQEVTKIIENFNLKENGENKLGGNSLFNLLEKAYLKYENHWQSTAPDAYKTLNESTKSIFTKKINGVFDFVFGSIAPLSSLNFKQIANAKKILENMLDKNLENVGQNLIQKFDIEINNSSIVNRIVYGKSIILLTGDAENDVFSKMNNIEYILGENRNIENIIVKIPHHGSSTSDHKILFSKELTENRNCTAIIAPHFRHKLPEASVLGKYRSAGYNVYQTASTNKGIIADDLHHDDPTGIVKITVSPTDATRVKLFGRAKEVL